MKRPASTPLAKTQVAIYLPEDGLVMLETIQLCYKSITSMVCPHLRQYGPSIQQTADRNPVTSPTRDLNGMTSDPDRAINAYDPRSLRRHEFPSLPQPALIMPARPGYQRGDLDQISPETEQREKV